MPEQTLTGYINTPKQQIEFRKELYDYALNLSYSGYSVNRMTSSKRPTMCSVTLFYDRPKRLVLIEKTKAFNYKKVKNVFKEIRCMDFESEITPDDFY